MGGAGSKGPKEAREAPKEPHYSDIGVHSGINISPPSFWDGVKEGFGFGMKEREDRLIKERREQIADAFSPATMQTEWDEYKKDWGKDGYFTYSEEMRGLFPPERCKYPPQIDAETGKSLCFQTSEDWPDDVKAAMATEIADNFKSFQNEYNPVRRTYEDFKAREGAVAKPTFMFAPGEKPHCAEKGGSCPEWSKTFKLHFEGTLPDDPRDLEGEALDRFNRFMFQKADEVAWDKTRQITNYLPYAGALINLSSSVSDTNKIKTCDSYTDEVKRKKCEDDLKKKASDEGAGGAKWLAADVAFDMVAPGLIDVVGKGVKYVVGGASHLAPTPSLLRAGAVATGEEIEMAGVRIGEGGAHMGEGVAHIGEGGAHIGEGGARTGAVAAHTAVYNFARPPPLGPNFHTGGGMWMKTWDGGYQLVVSGTKAEEKAAAKALAATARAEEEAAAKALAATARAEEEAAAKALAATAKAEEEAAAKALAATAKGGGADAAKALAFRAGVEGTNVALAFAQVNPNDYPIIPDPFLTHLPSQDYTSMYNDDLNYSFSPPLPESGSSGGSGSSILLVLVLGMGGYYLYRKLT